MALILATFFLSAFLKGMTGLGFSTVCLGTLASFVDIKIAIPLVIIPSLCSNILVMADSGKVREAVRRFWPMYIFTMAGLCLGLLLLGTVRSETARTVLGVVMLSYGVWAMLNGDVTIPSRLRTALSYPVGFSTGIINGLTGSQVMPMLPYLMMIKIDKNLLVASINFSFTLSSLIMLAGLTKMGFVTSQALIMAALGVPLVFVGIKLGSIIRKRASEEFFRKLVLLLLIGIGVNLVSRGLL